MYDVFSCFFDGNKVGLTVYCDTKEDGILQKLMDLANDSGDSQNSMHIRLMKLLQLTCTPPDKIRFLFFCTLNLFETTFIQFPYMVRFEEIPSPPPKYS